MDEPTSLHFPKCAAYTAELSLGYATISQNATHFTHIFSLTNKTEAIFHINIYKILKGINFTLKLIFGVF